MPLHDKLFLWAGPIMGMCAHVGPRKILFLSNRQSSSFCGHQNTKLSNSNITNVNHRIMHTNTKKSSGFNDIEVYVNACMNDSPNQWITVDLLHVAAQKMTNVNGATMLYVSSFIFLSLSPSLPLFLFGFSLVVFECDSHKR